MDENFSSHPDISGFAVAKLNVRSVLRCSLAVEKESGWDGHSKRSFRSRSGPNHYSVESRSWLTLTPREPKSAGLSADLTCLQVLFGKFVVIVPTRFAMKVFHRDGCFWSHAITTFESDQQWISTGPFSKFSMTYSASSESSSAPHNSNRGRLIVLAGATLDLAVSNLDKPVSVSKTA